MDKLNPNGISAPRVYRGVKLYLEGRVSPNGAGYYVKGDTGMYYVPEDFESCDCLDFQTNKQACKHIYASRLQKRMEIREAEIRAGLEREYRQYETEAEQEIKRLETEIENLQNKLVKIAQENFSLRTQLNAFGLLKEGLKNLIKSF